MNIGADHDNASVTLIVYKDASDWSTATTSIPYTAGAATEPLYIPFSAFTIGGGTGAGNFTNVGAIQLKITGSTGAHAEITTIEAIGPSQFTTNFANYQPATVGTTVFWDTNSDGIRDNSEPGAANVPVELLQNGSVVATTTTNAQGTYQFTGLAPGSYSVKFETASGIKFTTEGVGSNANINSDAIPSTGTTPVFTLTSGENDTTRNAGLLPVDLSIVKSVNNSAPVLGTNVQFTITVSNASGYSQATGVNVSDVLPAGLTYVSSSAAQGSYNSSTGVWTVGTLASGASTTLTITATTTAATQITNIATVTGTDEVDAAPPSQLTSSATLAPIAETDLALTKSVNNPTPAVGTNVTFTLTVTNNGPNTATGVTATDVLPAGLTFVSDTASQGSYNASNGVWSIGTVASGAAPITLSLITTVTTGGVKTNTATVTGNQNDPNPNNNTGTATVTPPGDIGDMVFWDNNKDGVYDSGDTKVAGVTVQLLQNGAVVATTTTDASGMYEFTGVAPGAYSVKFIAPSGAVYTTENVGTNATINSNVNPATGITPTFTLASGQDDFGHNAGLLPVDLTLVKTVNNPTPTVGTNVNFTITVSDIAGYSAATNLQVSDLLPAGFTYVASSTAKGTYNSSTGVWSVGTLASGSSASLVITATVNVTGVLTNTATVTHTDYPDPNPPTSTVTVTSDPPPLPPTTPTVTPTPPTKLSKFYFVSHEF